MTCVATRSTRPTALAPRGMVATPHYLASAAGLWALRSGGNAFDAAVTAAAVLTVVYPHMCSVGGDAFALIYDARTGVASGFNGSGRAPRAASRDQLTERGLQAMPTRGPLPVTVPGVMDAWEQLLARFGTWTLSDALGPAIDYARDGFPVTQRVADAIKEHADLLGSTPTSAKMFLPTGGPPHPGQRLAFPDLAHTLEKVAHHGTAVFYRGEIGPALARAVREQGGWLADDDLATHSGAWVAPLAASYRGVTVLELPPNTQGLLALLMLKLAEGFDLAALGHNSADAIHVLVEAKKQVFAVAESWISDPERLQAPIERLLGQAFIEQLRGTIRLDAVSSPSPAHAPIGGDTVYLCAVDADGSACSLIQSTYFAFGSGVVAGDTGVLLQNRGAYFSLDADHPNRLEPGKRTYHTLIPALALRDGRPWLVFGTMGADGQPQTQVQILANIIDHRMDVQCAIEMPRWRSGRFLVDESQERLWVEEDVPPEVLSDLERRGHRLQATPRWSESMGHAQAILIDGETGVLHGGADPRGDGAALGY